MWLPEIYRAFRRGRPSALGGLSVVRTTAAGDGDITSGPSLGRPAEYILGTTILRSAHLLYFLANEGNVFEIGERGKPVVATKARVADGTCSLGAAIGAVHVSAGRVCNSTELGWTNILHAGAGKFRLASCLRD